MLRNSGHQPNSPYCRFRGGFHTALFLAYVFVPLYFKPLQKTVRKALQGQCFRKMCGKLGLGHQCCLFPFFPAVPDPQNPDDFRLIIGFVTQSVIVFSKSDIQLSAPGAILQVRSCIGVIEQTGSAIFNGFKGLVSSFYAVARFGEEYVQAVKVFI